MIYLNKSILHSLSNTRRSKRLSQREVAARAGLPQSHLSRIENGAVDLRVSSLIALARVLGLELMLIPQSRLHAVQAVIRGDLDAEGDAGPAYKLDDEAEGDE